LTTFPNRAILGLGHSHSRTPKRSKKGEQKAQSDENRALTSQPSGFGHFYTALMIMLLSIRQEQIKNLIILGKTNSEIAIILGITQGTVNVIVHQILVKSNCKSRYELGSSMKYLTDREIEDIRAKSSYVPKVERKYTKKIKPLCSKCNNVLIWDKTKNHLVCPNILCIPQPITRPSKSFSTTDEKEELITNIRYVLKNFPLSIGIIQETIKPFLPKVCNFCKERLVLNPNKNIWYCKNPQKIIHPKEQLW